MPPNWPATPGWSTYGLFVAETIGFIGLGVMGKPMAGHLLKAGYSLVVHNRSRGASDELAAAGVQPQSDGKSLHVSVFLQTARRPQARFAGLRLTEMEPGTFAFRVNLLVGEEPNLVRIPIDAVIQPKRLRPSRLPVLVEAKSAGDYTNTNKRRKEEATKVRQLRAKHGKDIQLVLFLCGYFDAGYLGYEAAEGIDWVWEHRIEDFEKFGI